MSCPAGGSSRSPATACMLHARLGDERDRQALDGRALVEALSAQSNSRYSYGRIWRDEARQVFRRGDAYVAHEFYEDVNEPLAFLDFSEALDRHGLAYLGECNVAANFVRAMAPAAADTIAALAAGDDEGPRAIYRHLQRPRLPRIPDRAARPCGRDPWRPRRRTRPFPFRRRVGTGREPARGARRPLADRRRR